MSNIAETKRKRKISRSSVNASVPKLPPINEAQSSDTGRNYQVTQWLHAQQPTVEGINSTTTRRRLSSISTISEDTTAPRGSVWQSSSTSVQSPSRVFSYNPPSTVATFLRPDFRKGYVFGYSLVVNAVLQRYSNFMRDNEGNEEAVYEQNPTEVWLAKISDIHRDKIFMKERKIEERKYVEKRALELGSRSTDTFVTQRGKVAGASRSNSRLSNSSPTKSLNPSVNQRSQRTAAAVKQKIN